MVSSVSGGMPSMQQMQQMQQKMFKKADTDGSGGLDKTEFSNLITSGPGGAAPGGVTAEDAFGKIDANGDGQLTQSELDRGMKDMMTNLQSTMSVFGGSAAKGDAGLDSILKVISSASPSSSSATSESTSSKTSALVEKLQKLLSELSSSIGTGQSGTRLSIMA
jgi:Ca2+-binding EF-hand superfamily protein